MLNHYWTVNPKLKFNTNVSYQFGEVSNTRIDNGGTRLIEIDNEFAYLGGARNPLPNYYQNLPSYHLRNNNPTAYDFQLAFLAQKELEVNGQLNWNELYEANAALRNQGHNSLYALQADVVKDQIINVNSYLEAKLRENLILNAGIAYKNLNSENFARLDDLLGGTGFLDIDFFADENQNGISEDISSNRAQSNLRTPNRIAGVNDKYKYHYVLGASVARAFGQISYRYKKLNSYFGLSYVHTQYQREGTYENGFFPGEGPTGSFGKSNTINFSDFGIKGGATYLLTGRHLLELSM